MSRWFGEFGFFAGIIFTWIALSFMVDIATIGTYELNYTEAFQYNGSIIEHHRDLTPRTAAFDTLIMLSYLTVGIVNLATGIVGFVSGRREGEAKDRNLDGFNRGGR